MKIQNLLIFSIFIMNDIDGKISFILRHEPLKVNILIESITKQHSKGLMKIGYYHIYYYKMSSNISDGEV